MKTIGGNLNRNKRLLKAIEPIKESRKHLKINKIHSEGNETRLKDNKTEKGIEGI